MFSVLDQAGHDRLIQHFEWFYAAAGEIILTPSDTGEHVYFVLHGRLRIFIDLDLSDTFDPDEVVAVLGRGSVLGHMEACQDTRFDCMAQAVRNTEFGRMSRQRFVDLANDYPQIWKSIASDTVDQLRQSRSRDRDMKETHYLTLMPVDSGVEVGNFASRLYEEMAGLASTTVITKEAFNEALGEGAADDDIDVWDDTDREAMGWLSEQEEEHTFLTLQAEANASAWTRRCLRSADRILFVADGGSEEAVRDVESLIVQQNTMSRWAKRELVLLYDDTVELPSHTREWLRVRPWISQVYHLKPSRKDDIQRLARCLTRRAIGLVLAGGGARGCAHIGVIRALRELNIPIDHVAGTSAGAGFGAQVAHKWDDAKIADAAWKGCVETAPFTAFNLPYHSFVRKGPMKAVVQGNYGETHIEDLWLPFFCISCDLSSQQKVVHTTGRLWKALRATTALPGIFPPAVLAGRCHVDGGVVDNEPIEDMKRLNPGPSILISLSVAAEDFLGANVIDIPTNFSVIRSLIHPLLEPIRVPNVLDVIIKTMTLSSDGKSTAELADLYIAPDTTGYSLLDFTAMDELTALGYNATMAAVEAHANDEAFLTKFSLKLGEIPAKLPRMVVPRWKSLERERSRLRATVLGQGLMLFVLCGLLISAVQGVLFGLVQIMPTLVVSGVIALLPIGQGVVKMVALRREARQLQAASKNEELGVQAP